MVRIGMHVCLAVSGATHEGLAVGFSGAGFEPFPETSWLTPQQQTSGNTLCACDHRYRIDHCGRDSAVLAPCVLTAGECSHSLPVRGAARQPCLSHNFG